VQVRGEAQISGRISHRVALLSALALSGCDQAMTPSAPDDGGASDARAEGAGPTVVDTDGDKVPDALEDLDGDGRLGCCVERCGKPSPQQKARCFIAKDGCGMGQRCEASSCTPTVSYACSAGESDPRDPTTFDELGDASLPNFVCWPDFLAKQAPTLTMHRSTTGDWTLALSPSVAYTPLSIQGANPKEAAAALDARGVGDLTAGFILSRDTVHIAAPDEVSGYAALLAATGLGQVTLRAAGTSLKTHDDHDAVGGTFYDLKTTAAQNASTVRNAVLAALLGRPLSALSGLPTPLPGNTATEHVIRLHTVRRHSSVDPTAGRLIISGAVAAKAHYQDVSRGTGMVADYLSGGSLLAGADHTIAVECDSGVFGGRALLDLLWVVDGSASMLPHRTRLLNNAANLWSRARASGMDFRMGVAGMDPAQKGALCEGRFFGTHEGEALLDCIVAPPGSAPEQPDGLAAAAAAVKARLPRSLKTLPGRVRGRAKLVVIVVTDGVPDHLAAALGSPGPKTCTLTASEQQVASKAAAPLVELLTGQTDPEASAMLHLIGGACHNRCGLPVAHGYARAVQQLGGQIVDLCRKDWGNRLQVMLDSIIGCCCGPVVLERVPIVPSLSVAVNAARLQRSRQAGFDYRAHYNSLVLINVPYPDGAMRLHIAASYRRWRQK
jgi:hypothetical protein